MLHLHAKMAPSCSRTRPISTRFNHLFEHTNICHPSNGGLPTRPKSHSSMLSVCNSEGMFKIVLLLPGFHPPWLSVNFVQLLLSSSTFYIIIYLFPIICQGILLIFWLGFFPFSEDREIAA